MAEHYKGIMYRFKQKDSHVEFFYKGNKLDKNFSFQSFVDKAIKDFLEGKYNPYEKEGEN